MVVVVAKRAAHYGASTSSFFFRLLGLLLIAPPVKHNGDSVKFVIETRTSGGALLDGGVVVGTNW